MAGVDQSHNKVNRNVVEQAQGYQQYTAQLAHGEVTSTKANSKLKRAHAQDLGQGA